MSIRSKYLLVILFACLAHRTVMAQEGEFDSLLIRKIVVENPVYKPVIGFGAGITNFYGDVMNSHINPLVGQFAFKASISTFLDGRRYFIGNFHFIYGRLTGNERNLDNDNTARNLNFSSDIMVFGLNAEYNFGHFFTNTEPVLRPFISLGIENITFNSKGDLIGPVHYTDGTSGMTVYHYWPDGTIRDIPVDDRQTAAGNLMFRDWEYETDLRVLNADHGFKKYSQNTFAIPVDLGIDFHLNSRVKMRLGTSLHLTFTDFIDNVAWEDTEISGDYTNDHFTFSYLSMHLDLFSEPKVITEELMFAELDEFDYSLFEDEDNDGVLDLSDDCPGTPAGVEVDTTGCPYDDDQDGVPDYLDKQRDTPAGAFVDDEGVQMNEDEIASRVNFTDAAPRADLHLYLEGVFASEPRMTLADMPEKFGKLDEDADGYLSFDEMLNSIDDFFDFESELVTDEIYLLINFFFKQ